MDVERDLPLQRPRLAPMFPERSFHISKGSPRRRPLTGPIPLQVLAPSLQRLCHLRPLPETAPPPPPRWMPRELRGCSALEKVMRAKGGQDHKIA